MYIYICIYMYIYIYVYMIVYIYTILPAYLEYSEFQPHGCEQKKYILENQWDNPHMQMAYRTYIHNKFNTYI